MPVTYPSKNRPLTEADFLGDVEPGNRDHNYGPEYLKARDAYLAKLLELTKKQK